MSTTRSTRTVDRRFLAAGAVVLSLAVVAVGLFRGTRRDADLGPALPELARTVSLTGDGRPLEPTRLQVVGDTLFVAYNGEARLDAYGLDLQRLRTIELAAPEPILPSAFAVTDTSIVVCDHRRGIVAIFDRSGRYRTSFGTLPDGETKLAPLALTCYAGVAYVADIRRRKVLAIALNEDLDVTEQGELVLEIPASASETLGFPSAVMVTPDGRLLVGDAEDGRVRVFTCDGQAIYAFAEVPGFSQIAPQGLAQDAVRDPGLQKPETWDPSGLPRQGRVHVVDGYNGKIHVHNPVGRYLGSYPRDERLAAPAGIAVADSGRSIYVSDPPRGRILEFRVKGE